MPCYIVRFFKFWAEVLIWSLLTKTSFPLPSIQCIFPMLVLLLLCSWIWIFFFLLIVKWWWYWNWRGTGSVGLFSLRFFSWLDLRLSNSRRTGWCLCSLGPFLTNTSWVRWATLRLQFSYCGSLFGWGQGGMVTHLFIEHVLLHDLKYNKLLCSHLL